MGISIPVRRDLHVETGPCPSVHRDNVLNMFIALPYRSGHDGAAVMLPRFVIKWLQNQLTKRPHLSDMNHDDIIKWKHFPRYWPFVRGIHRSPLYLLYDTDKWTNIYIYIYILHNKLDTMVDPFRSVYPFSFMPCFITSSAVMTVTCYMMLVVDWQIVPTLQLNTVRPRYIAVTFLQITHERHP